MSSRQSQDSSKSKHDSETTNNPFGSILALTKHPALPTTSLIACGGVALMVANLLYAKLLEPGDFGRLILLESVAFVAMGLLPFGFDNLIVRKEVATPAPVLRVLLVVGLCLGTAIVSLSHYFTGVSIQLLLFVLAAGVAGAATRLFAAVEQSKLRFVRSQVISQAPLILFLGSAVFHTITGLSSWQRGGVAYVLSFVLSAILGGVSIRASGRTTDQSAVGRELWVRALVFVGISASLLVLNQMERLIAAAVLGMRELGVLGLATTLIASPFRLLSTGVGYTLMPRLRACDSKVERRRLMRHEYIIAMAIGIPGALLLLLLVPFLVTILFGDEYEITMSLVIALIILGLIRLNLGVFATAVNALGGTQTLHLFNLTGWITVGLAVAAALALSGFGSTGIVVGVTLGWIIRILSAGLLIRKEF